MAGSEICIAAVPQVIRGTILVLFTLSSLLVILVVLAQEGKGGGLAGAFGGAGAETFGVKAGTVNLFTSWLAAIFLGLALLHAGLDKWERSDAAPGIDRFTQEGGAEPGKEGPSVAPPGGAPPGDASPGGGDAPPGDAPPGEKNGEKKDDE